VAPELTRQLTVRAVRRRYLLLSGLRWFATGLTFPVQMLLYADRGLDLSAVGLLLALFAGLIVVLELPTGGLADLLGRRRTMLVSAATYVCAALCVAVAQQWWQFAIAVSLSAVARALGSGPLDAWYVDTVRAVDPGTSLRAGISWGWAIEALALGAAAIVGGTLPGWFGWLPAGGPLVPMSVPALGAATVGLVSLAAHAILMVEPRPARGPRRAVLLGVPGQIRDGARLAWTDPVIRILAARTAMVGLAIVTLEMLAPLQFAALLGGPERAAAAYGMLVTAAWLGSGAGSASAPALCRLGAALGLRTSLATGAAATALVAAAVGLLGLAAAGLGGFVLAATGYVLAYVLAGVPGPLAMEVLHERVDPARRATLISVSSLALQLGVLGGSLTVPRLAGQAGFGYGWLAAMIALLLAAFLALRASAATHLSLGQGGMNTGMDGGPTRAVRGAPARAGAEPPCRNGDPDQHTAVRSG
jgi:Major Facilitator Superfamily